MASPPAAEAAVAAADEEGQRERGRIALDLAIARKTNVHPLYKHFSSDAPYKANMGAWKMAAPPAAGATAIRPRYAHTASAAETATAHGQLATRRIQNALTSVDS
jgi:hypothetical protein